MSLSRLRTLDFYSLFENELGGTPRPRELARVLDQFWPEVSEGCRGNAVMAPQDAALLEELFELFGVPLKVADNSLQVVGHAYDVFALALEPYVDECLRNPLTFDRFVHDWPADWREYARAVAAQDKSRAREYAVKLQPLAPECVFPPGVRLPQPPAQDNSPATK